MCLFLVALALIITKEKGVRKMGRHRKVGRPKGSKNKRKGYGPIWNKKNRPNKWTIREKKIWSHGYRSGVAKYGHGYKKRTPRF